MALHIRREERKSHNFTIARVFILLFLKFIYINDDEKFS